MGNWSILQISSAGQDWERPISSHTPKTATIRLAAEIVTFVRNTCRMPMLKTDIAALKIDKDFTLIEVLLPVEEAVS
jgi:hypothetical protein